MGTVLYFDMFSGISGDMCAGAFIDMGLDEKEVKRILSLLPLDREYSFSVKKKQVGSITGTDFSVSLSPDGHEHRTMKDIREMLEDSGLPQRTKETAVRIFTLLAKAEGKIHGREWENVHFHETGAVDSIIDITVSAFALEYFNVTSCYSSPFHLGTGQVTCEHGTLPVPAPAVLELIKNTPAIFTEIETELTTPTGAALIRAAAESPGAVPPEFTVSATGLGCGKKDIPEIPNMLRIVSGEESTVTSPLVELTTDIDDSVPEHVGYLTEKILSAGALDCTVTHVLMKKGRPGIRISVLCSRQDREMMKRILFRETSTFGIREVPAVRSKLRKETVSAELPYGTVSCTIGYLDNERVTVSPEYENCRTIALSEGIPLKAVYTQAVRKAEEMLQKKQQQTE